MAIFGIKFKMKYTELNRQQLSLILVSTARSTVPEGSSFSMASVKWIFVNTWNCPERLFLKENGIHFKWRVNLRTISSCFYCSLFDFLILANSIKRKHRGYASEHRLFSFRINRRHGQRGMCVGVEELCPFPWKWENVENGALCRTEFREERGNGNTWWRQTFTSRFSYCLSSCLTSFW